MTAFRYRANEEAAPESPEALFRDLRPRDRSVRDLYLRQGDVLRAYQEQSPAPSDVALELPTGAGKTLVGLLIAEWRRRALDHRVAYLCPTVQLARQVADKAESYGLEVVTLVRAQAEWSQADWNRYARGRAVAISTYHAVFNSNPRLNTAQTLVLDDAHAGEGAVANLWTIAAQRGSELYAALLSIIRPSLPPSVAERLADDELEGRRQRHVDLVSPLAMVDNAAALTEAIAANASGHNRYALDVIGDNLTRCLLYVSWAEISLRPLIAPTASHLPFADADQRIYMSATLGGAGELERAFGVDEIVRPRMPTRDDERGFGRRLFLMPGASRSPEEADRAISAAIEKTGRAVLLTQSSTELEDLVEAVVPKGASVVGAEEIEHDPKAFVDASPAVLALANRYDGIDLPDQACRLIVMSGLPRGAHQQERFLAERLGAGRVLDERVRTRLTQGSGRCTRNPQDFAAVLIRGQGLLDFLSRDEQLLALRPELQAEIEFGLDNSEQEDDEADFLVLIEAMLERTQEWAAADDYLRRQTADRDRELPSDSDALARAASLEVRSWRALWRGDARRAVALAQEAVDALSGGSEIRPYRALWLYLAASWARELGESGDQDQLELAERLQGEVERTAERLAWMPHHPNRPMTPTVSKEDERAARAATRLAELGVRGRRFETELAALQTQLGASTAKQFEIGLDTLGQMLGFETWRPERDGPKQAAPDGAWRAGGLWLVWEAKSGVGSETPLSVRAVRQAETHERWLEREGRWEQPERKLTLLVAAGRDIDDAAAKIAGEQRLVSTAIVRTIANETMDAYREVRARARGLDTEGRTRAFAKAFIARRLDTAQLQARLSERRVADG